MGWCRSEVVSLIVVSRPLYCAREDTHRIAEALISSPRLLSVDYCSAALALKNSPSYLSFVRFIPAVTITTSIAASSTFRIFALHSHSNFLSQPSQLRLVYDNATLKKIAFNNQPGSDMVTEIFSSTALSSRDPFNPNSLTLCLPPAL